MAQGPCYLDARVSGSRQSADFQEVLSTFLSLCPAWMDSSLAPFLLTGVQAPLCLASGGLWPGVSGLALLRGHWYGCLEPGREHSPCALSGAHQGERLEGVPAGVLSSAFREAIVEGLKLHISSLNTLQNWSPQLSLTMHACPDVISWGPVGTKNNWLGGGGGEGGSGVGGPESRRVLLEKLCASAFLVQLNFEPR